MSSLGGEFLGEEYFSVARFNTKVPSHLTGAQIAALSPIYPCKEVTCTVSGSGFVKDVKYRRNTDNTAWLSDSGGKHLHDVDSDAGGGLLSNVLIANLAKVIYLPDGVLPSAGMFKHETSGGATITDSHPNVRLYCGTANGAYAHATRSGVGVSWTQPIRFIARLFVSHGTYVTARFGVASESANDAPAGDGGGIRRMGFEACDSAGTTRNYDVFSSNGTTRSAVTSTTAVAQASAHAYKLDYTPATNIQAYLDGSGTPLITKTSAVPASGTSNDVRVVSAGVKQNNSFSAPNERIMQLSGLAIAATASSTNWG